MKGCGNVESRWRVFFAVEIPGPERERVMRHIARLRDLVPDVAASWARDESLHLTLKFIGEVSSSRMNDLSAAASRAVAGITPFPIVLEGAGVFPTVAYPRVLWIGVADPTGKLHQLQAQLETECEAAGFAKEQRRFHPHLTLARIRKPAGARKLAETHLQSEFSATEFLVKRLQLFRSELSPKGSRYTVLSSITLYSVGAPA
jgi:2'-5' RNA ligase